VIKEIDRRARRAGGQVQAIQVPGSIREDRDRLRRQQGAQQTLPSPLGTFIPLWDDGPEVADGLHALTVEGFEVDWHLVAKEFPDVGHEAVWASPEAPPKRALGLK